MITQTSHTTEIAKAIIESIGYLELGMSEQAIRRLGRVRDGGVFAPVTALLRKEVARRERRRERVFVGTGNHARPKSPEPVNKGVWLILAACCHAAGQTHRVAEALAYARGAPPSKPESR
jgi:hypothetical protein